MTTPLLTAPRAAAATSGLARTGLAAVALASIATSTVAALGQAAGVGLEVGGEPIPVLGFASLTAVFSLVGLVLAAVLARVAAHPRTAFVRTTVVLTVLSLVPDLLADASSSTKALLMTTHLVAALIVVPAVARRLSV